MKADLARTVAEAEFQTAMLVYMRRAGTVAWGLLDRMVDEADDGALRQDLMRMAQRALADLPVQQ